MRVSPLWMHPCFYRSPVGFNPELGAKFKSSLMFCCSPSDHRLQSITSGEEKPGLTLSVCFSHVLTSSGPSKRRAGRVIALLIGSRCSTSFGYRHDNAPQTRHQPAGPRPFPQEERGRTGVGLQIRELFCNGDIYNA